MLKREIYWPVLAALMTGCSMPPVAQTDDSPTSDQPFAQESTPAQGAEMPKEVQQSQNVGQIPTPSYAKDSPNQHDAGSPNSIPKKSLPAWANEATIKSIENGTPQEVSSRIKELTKQILRHRQAVDPEFIVRIINRVLSALHPSLSALNQELCRNVLYLLYCQDSLQDAHAPPLTRQFIAILARHLGSIDNVSVWLGRYLQTKKPALGFWRWLKQFDIDVAAASSGQGTPTQAQLSAPLQELKNFINNQNQGKDSKRALDMMQMVISGELGEKLQAVRILEKDKYLPTVVFADQAGLATNRKYSEQQWYFTQKLDQIIRTQTGTLTPAQMQTLQTFKEKLEQAAKRLQNNPNQVTQALKTANTPQSVVQALLGK